MATKAADRWHLRAQLRDCGRIAVIGIVRGDDPGFSRDRLGHAKSNVVGLASRAGQDCR